MQMMADGTATNPTARRTTVTLRSPYCDRLSKLCKAGHRSHKHTIELLIDEEIKRLGLDDVNGDRVGDEASEIPSDSA